MFFCHDGLNHLSEVSRFATNIMYTVQLIHNLIVSVDFEISFNACDFFFYDEIENSQTVINNENWIWINKICLIDYDLTLTRTQVSELNSP